MAEKIEWRLGNERLADGTVRRWRERTLENGDVLREYEAGTGEVRTWTPQPIEVKAAA